MIRQIVLVDLLGYNGLKIIRDTTLPGKEWDKLDLWLDIEPKVQRAFEEQRH